MKTFIKIIILLGLAVYFVFAITLFNEPKKGAVCSGVDTVIEDSLQTGFINEDEVRNILIRYKLFPEGCKIEDINLKVLEDTLARNPYIDKVLCYRTNNERICIRVTPLLPVLHVMNNTGEDYYLDSKGKVMPRNGYRANLVIATGHISKEYARKNLASLGRFIQQDAFWNKQIQQINVLKNGDIELTPRIGDHTILLGESVRFREKLARLKLFYTEGLNKAGWNKYTTLNLKYDNQIICTKKK